MDTKTMIMNIWNGKRKQIKQNAAKEAEKIFIKTNPGTADKNGNFPQVGPNMPKAYNKEAKRIERQVIKTRVEQSKKSK
jgi:hypothetical protein